MYPEEIKNCALNAAKIYYEYQNKHNTAIAKIQIVNIRKEKSDWIFTLKKELTQDKKCYNISIDGKIINKDNYKILKYDDENKDLFIRFNVKINCVLTIENVHIESNLLFLTENVIKWYEAPDNLLKLPTMCPDIPDFPLSEKYTPALSQQEAIDNIKCNPLSYIWGAPGTGKTKFVLAKCVADYIQKFKNNNSKQKILVCAPTNNALEQILFGVFKVLDDENISTNAVLRLGIPSKKFSQKYPKSCENIAIHNQIESIKNNINELTEILTKRSEIKDISFFNSIFSDFSIKTERLKHSKIKAKEKNKQIQITIDKLDYELSKLKIELHDTELFLNENEKFKKKLLNRIIKSKQSAIQYEYDKLNIKKHELNDAIINKNTKLNLLKKTLEEIENDEYFRKEFSNIKNKLFDMLKKYNNSESKAIQSLLAYLRNYIDVELETFLHLAIDKCKEIIRINNDFINSLPYGLINDCEIQEKVKQLNSEHKRLESLDVSTQIADANVIGLTVDKFIIEYTLFKELMNNTAQKINHIFVDEAAYLSLIKGLTLFSFNTPITLLGDHMQLPPVYVEAKEYMKIYPELLLWKYPIIYCGDLFSKQSYELFANSEDDLTPLYWGISKSDLNITYRFGNNLSKILCGTVYSERFSSANSTNPIKITVVNVPKLGNNTYKGRVNTYEISAINDFIKSYSTKIGTFAVLTPYRNQATELIHSLPDKTNCMTIHSSQGQEWDTVIISTVDDFSSKNLKIINTAVSRAKKNLIVVCNTKLWELHPDSLIAKIISIADYIINYISIDSYKNIQLLNESND